MIKKVFIIIVFIFIGLLIHTNYNYYILESSENYDNTAEHRELCGFEDIPEKSITESINKYIMSMNENIIFTSLLILVILLILKNYKYLNFNTITYSEEILPQKDSVINKIIFAIIFILIGLLLLKNYIFFTSNLSKENNYSDNYASHRELGGCGGSKESSLNW